MDFKAIVSNPWVLGGGLAIGALVLLTTGSAKSSAGASGYDPNVVLGLAQLSAQQGQAGMDYSANLATIAAGASKDFTAARVTENLKLVDAITNMQALFFTNAQRERETAAGVTNSRIQSMTALALDQQQEQIRLATTYVAADVSKYTTAADITKTRIAAAAQEHSADLAASSANLGAVLGLFH